MAARLNWKTRLEPFAQKLEEMRDDIAAMLSVEDDKELRRIISACQKPSDTNCWWAILRVAPTVKDEAEYILRDRKKA